MGLFSCSCVRELAVIMASLARIEAAVGVLVKKEGVVASTIDSLTAEVARNTSVEQSAVTLIQGLADQIKAAGTDPAKLSAIVAQLEANDDALAAAVAANTQADAATAT